MSFIDKKLANHLRSNSNFFIAKDFLDYKYISSCLSDYTINVEITKNKKTIATKSDSSYSTSYSNNIELDNIPEFIKNKKALYENYCIGGYFQNYELQIILGNIPLRVRRIHKYKSLDEIKGSNVEISFNYNGIQYSPDQVLSDLLINNLINTSLLLSHKYDKFIVCTNFTLIKRTKTQIVFKANKIGYPDIN